MSHTLWGRRGKEGISSQHIEEPKEMHTRNNKMPVKDYAAALSFKVTVHHTKQVVEGQVTP